MRIPGRAWLEFTVEPGNGGSTIRQTAIFDSVGFFELAYWYGIYPIHALVFRSMLSNIAAAAVSRFVFVGIVSVCEFFCPRLLLATEPMHLSVNFTVDSFAGGPSPARVAVLCESLRNELGRGWCDGDLTVWNPRCEIVVHATLTKYVQAVGQNGSQTLGSSLIQVNEGRALSRRIDLLVDAAGDLPALGRQHWM